jgi:hypothetical protein
MKSLPGRQIEGGRAGVTNELWMMEDLYGRVTG